MTGIYILTSPTNRIYVGQSHDIETRRYRYANLICESQPRIYNSLKKYGFEAHQFNVILELREDISQSQLDYWEQFFIDHYRSEGIELLNLKEGGSRGKQHLETKEKIGRSNKLRHEINPSEKLIRNVERLKNNKGKKMSDEARANMSANSSRHKNSPEHKKRLLLVHTGRKHREEDKQKIREGNSKLNELQVRIVIKCLNFGMTCIQIGKIFKVTKSCISDIKFCRTFQNIPRAKGERTTCAILIPQQVRIIFHAYKFGCSSKDLAKIFNITKSGIEGIVHRRNWKSLTNDIK